MLVIDDEPRVLDAVAQLVELHGWKAIVAAEGHLGIEMYERDRPDVVVLDLAIHGLNGVKVLQILRDRDPDVTIVLLTRPADITTAVEAIAREPVGE